jgi:hypothetical protein
MSGRASLTRSRLSPTEAELADLATLADDLLGAAMATRRSEAILVRTQAACLAWLSVGDRAPRCGYSSVSRVALEYLGLSPRTVRERLSLHRLFARFPAMERAFLEDRMSACQALAAAPILDEIQEDDEVTIARWIETAGRVSVRALRYEVRSQREAKTQIDTSDADAAGMSDDNNVVPNDTNPASAPDVLVADSGDGNQPDTSDAADSDPPASIDPSSSDATDPDLGSPLDSSMRDASDPSSSDATDPEGRTISFTAPVGFQIVFDQTIDLARKVLGWEAPVHQCIAAILAEANWTGVGAPPKDPRWLRPPARITVRPRADVPIRPEAIAHARATLEEVHRYIGDVLDLVESGEPRSPRDALLRLRQIQLLRSPQRVLFAHMIRDLRRTYAMDLLGYRSMAELVEDRLGLSERSARNRVAESLLFESDAEIEGAVGRGEISLMQAHLIRRLHCADIEPFVQRARETSWRQFQREYRLLELLRKCGLGRLAAKPLPQSRVEEGLIEALGGDREAIEEKLRQWGIPPLPPDGATDPAQNCIVMDRLEALVEMLASTLWDEVPKIDGLDRQMSAALAPQIRIRFWAPNPTADDFEGVIDHFRKRHAPRISTWAALVVLFAQVKEEWEREDPERRPVRAKILKRDHYRCVVPGCGRRSQLEDHHINFRSEGGGDEDTNRSTLCHGHHAHMVHRGYVRISGKAPYALRFELGCLEGGPPLMILLGEKKISTPWA